MATEIAVKALDPLKYLNTLSKAERLDPYTSSTTTRTFLFNAFDAYRQEKTPIPPGIRSKVQQQLLALLPAIEDGLKNIYHGLNADKRIEAQCCLSGLEFITSDLANDIGDKKQQLLDLMHSDTVEDIKEFIENTADSSTYGNVEVPDLANVPKTHTWWKDEFQS